jgi:DNA-binding response OmpR family regulator
VLPAADGRAALTLAERHRRQIDLLLTDVVMPGLSGPELVRHLRRLRPQMLVLYMSGYNDSGLVTRGIEEAQVELIQKPFNPDELVARVEALVRLEPRLGAGNGN